MRKKVMIESIKKYEDQLDYLFARVENATSQYRALRDRTDNLSDIIIGLEKRILQKIANNNAIK